VSALICGSLAFDNIMVFRGRFRDHILPDQIHILNVAFLVPELRREFGGCAGNVAYNLRLLGGSPLIMATVGTDFGRYRDWLAAGGHDLRHVTEVPGTLTAQAYITTDLDDNQITAFHPGAMDEAHRNRVPTDGSIRIGIVSPDGRQAMLDHAAQFQAAGIPFVFDPGQGLPMFNGEELRKFVDQATWLAVNDYEGRLLTERTGLSLETLARQLQGLVLTRGAEGSSVYLPDRRIDIPSVKAAAVLDPTGCGDAYRAGLLHGLSRGWGWEETGRLAALLGALKVAHRGTQNHRFTQASITSDYRAAFGHALPA
jgi:adenosine kinase